MTKRKQGIVFMSIFDLFNSIKTASSMGKVEWVIAGLGNPGRKYEKSRHNVGFLTLDLLAREYNAKIDRIRFKGLTGETTIGERVLLVKPQTFMNLSGECISEVLNWYKLPSARLIVIYDDVNLAPGRIRIRSKGSDGGHNGIKSTIYQLNTDVFPRIKIGVGSPDNTHYEMVDWVLGTFNDEDGRAVTDAIKRAALAVKEIIQNGTESAAAKYNGTTFNPETK